MQAVEDGLAYLILDGKVVAAGRCLLRPAAKTSQVRQTCRPAVGIGVSDQVASSSALQVVMVVV